MKRCTKCGEIKEFTEFYQDKSKKDGLKTNCKACNKQYQQANREKILEQQKKYRKQNREKILERSLRRYQANRDWHERYYQANREKILEQKKKYRQANPDKHRAHEQKRRALKKNAAGDATAIEIQARFDYHGNRCYYCGCDGKMTIEHRIPLSRGGSHHPANIVPACQTCNSSKRAKTEKEFRKMLTSVSDNVQ